jgi:hypothetical protein
MELDAILLARIPHIYMRQAYRHMLPRNYMHDAYVLSKSARSHALPRRLAG